MCKSLTQARKESTIRMCWFFSVLIIQFGEVGGGGGVIGVSTVAHIRLLIAMTAEE